MADAQVKLLTMNNGLTIPQLGLGTWKSEPGEVYAAVREALRLGYRHIDCAHAYQNEAEIGRALTDARREDGIRREDLFVTSKLWNNAHLPDDVGPGLDNTLTDLQLDYIDLYLIHWPVAFAPDVGFPETGDEFLSPEEAPLDATWRAMETLVDAGKARSIGVSNYNANKLAELMDYARIPPAMNQIEVHPFNTQESLLRVCEGHGVTVTGYSPLGSIDRPEQFKGKDEPVLREHSVPTEIAERIGRTPAQVLIAWSLSKGIACIPKSTNPGRIRENLEATEVELTAEDIAKLDGLNRDFRYIDGSFYTIEGSPYTQEYIWVE